MEVMVYSENERLFSELVYAANALDASKIIGAVIGKKEDAEMASKLTDEVYFLDSSKIGDFRPREYAEGLFQIFSISKPEILLIGGTQKGNAISAMLSAKLGIPSITEVSELKRNDGLIAVRSAFGGVAIAEIASEAKAIFCLKPGAFPSSETERNGEVRELEVEIKQTTEVLEVRQKERLAEIEDARVVVVAGRGVKKKEDLSIVEELAKIFGGVVGVTRPLSADLHWAPTWVGMSGIAVKPDLYIGVGVSGQIQHIAGIRNSKFILAINIDPNAPIFEHADYGIVGDLYKVVPKLVEMLKG
jgi:electron transfer flavoprotein alpha subunit